MSFEIFYGQTENIRRETQETPFFLTFEAKAVVFTEIGQASVRIEDFRIQGNDEELHCNPDLLEEASEQASFELCSVKVNFLNSIILKFIIHIF